MSKLSNYALTVNPTTDIVCAYASGMYVPAPTATDAPWVVIGSFQVPEAVTARLEVIGCKSGTASLAVALHNPTYMAGSMVAVTAATDAKHTSAGTFDIVPGVTYLIAAQFQGTASVGVVRTVSLGGV
jgi:hypothetical protein